MNRFPVIPKPQSVVPKEGQAIPSAPIEYIFDASLPKEGYRIVVERDSIKVVSSSDAGRFYANATLTMLKDALGYYPASEVTDAPKVPFRAVMLDVGRYFFPVEDVKTLIDDASSLKLNVLYLHLSEDQGWRAAIDSRPKLQEVGSKRKKTNWFPIPCSGFYTKDELREIVAYAHKNQMLVIPEIDVPGHVRAAIAAYPELACFQRKRPVATHWGVKHDILCAGKESTYRFLYDVFSELSEIFPDGYFGLGGDEAVKTRWKLCPDCQRTIREQGLPDEDALQTYFMNRLNREFFKPRGIRPAIWVHGDVPEGLDKDFVLLHYGAPISDPSRAGFEVSDTLGRSVKKGYLAIDADSRYYYFDFPHALTSLSRCYEGGKDLEPRENLLGGLVSIWTEYIPRMKTLERRVFPRLLAASEGMWTKYDPKEYNGFAERAELYEEAYGKNRNFTRVADAEPAGSKRILQRLWWARRPLHWEGLGNLIDNAKVARLAAKQAKNKEETK